MNIIVVVIPEVCRVSEANQTFICSLPRNDVYPGSGHSWLYASALADFGISSSSPGLQIMFNKQDESFPCRSSSLK